MRETRNKYFDFSLTRRTLSKLFEFEINLVCDGGKENAPLRYNLQLVLLIFKRKH